MNAFQSTRLFATLLLLSLLGCTKQDGPTPSSAPTASYKLDGIKVNCLATARAYTDNSTGSSYDFLQIRLTTTPQPASGPESLNLEFAKSSSQPTSTYVLTHYYLLNTAYPNGLPYSLYKVNLTAPITTSFSGTFSGEFNTFVNGKYYIITEGIFTNLTP